MRIGRQAVSLIRNPVPAFRIRHRAVCLPPASFVLLGHRMPTRTLYLCYFGLREPLVQTQVLPYLRKLAESGVGVSLLTFEARLKELWTREELEAERARLEG